MYDKQMLISERAKQELVFWANLPDGLCSPISLPVTSLSLTTDASPSALGILFDGFLISDPMPEEFKDFSIIVQELAALDRFLDLFPNVSDVTITWRCDNNSALAAIKNEGSTHSWPLNSLSGNILERCLNRNILLDPVRISSEENIIADAASRQKMVPDWSLDPNITAKVFARYGVADVDLMATDLSRKCPLFFSWSRKDVEVLIFN